MKGIKFIGFFAVSGFILSFLFGLFSHTSFLSIILKALLFGVIFGVLGFLISVIFDKFLADDTADYIGDNVDVGAGVENGGASQTSSSKGHFVDITIQDEELTESEGDNHFVVGDNHQMLNETDIKGRVTQQNDKQNQGFVPLKNFENLKDLSGKESISPEELGKNAGAGQYENTDINDNAGNQTNFSKSMENSTGSIDNIDTLPDMNHLDFASEDDSDDEVIDTNTDSDFVSSANIHKKNDGEMPEVKDAALIAKAISSVLSDEES